MVCVIVAQTVVVMVSVVMCISLIVILCYHVCLSSDLIFISYCKVVGKGSSICKSPPRPGLVLQQPPPAAPGDQGGVEALLDTLGHPALLGEGSGDPAIQGASCHLIVARPCQCCHNNIHSRGALKKHIHINPRL